uniref:Uncharacterized protein n=1 Tax=Arundo donax TaxID=35708 RepID=A0A0A9AT89_ARUDO
MDSASSISVSFRPECSK